MNLDLWRTWLTMRRPAMLELLRDWVERESPSGDAERLRGLADAVAAAFTAVGGVPARHALSDGLEALELRLAGRAEGPGPLLLGHLDTVYPAGTLARMPFEVCDGRVRGPGALDMKGGLVQALFALRVLQAHGVPPARTVRCLFVPDEETGSRASCALTGRVAAGCSAALVLEPAAGANGDLKTRRKGIARYTLAARGISAHAGLDFERGANAIVELARRVAEIAAWSDPPRGLTVNTGVVAGGTRCNVVPDAARAEIEARAWTAAELMAVEERLRGLRPADPRVRLELEGGLNRPPMEPSEGSRRLFERAQRYGRELGLRLGEAAVGGASDGNFTAALGVPTLDGLGMVGDGAHAPHEHFLLEPWAARTALVAGLLAEEE